MDDYETTDEDREFIDAMKALMIERAYDMDPTRMVANLGALFFHVIQSMGVDAEGAVEMVRESYRRPSPALVLVEKDPKDLN